MVSWSASGEIAKDAGGSVIYESIILFAIIRMYNRLGWGSIASRAEVMLMQFSFTDVIMLGMFLLALLTYLKKRK